MLVNWHQVYPPVVPSQDYSGPRLRRSPYGTLATVSLKMDRFSFLQRKRYQHKPTHQSPAHVLPKVHYTCRHRANVKNSNQLQSESMTLTNKQFKDLRVILFCDKVGVCVCFSAYDVDPKPCQQLPVQPQHAEPRRYRRRLIHHTNTRMN